jgi:diaminopimelate decarboxylase
VSGRSYLSINAKGHLEVAGCDVVTLARKYGTPLYVMNEDLIRENCRRYVSGLRSRYPDSSVAYAGKAFLCGWICEVAQEEGLYLDVVSGGELYTALRARFPAERILFHGNNKSVDEIAMGLKAQVARFVIDSYFEMETLQAMARRLNQRAGVLLRISPGVEAHTHQYIETGMLDSKFGFGLTNGEAWRAVKRVLSCDHLSFQGIHSHIGSQIFRTEGPNAQATRMVDFMVDLKADLGVEVAEMDLGGGLGVTYTPDDEPPSVESFLDVIARTVLAECEKAGVRPPRLLIEPGRSIVGEAGITLYTAGAIKDVPGVRKYVSVDGGMGDNPRPALYGAICEAIVANRADDPAREVVCLAGKCCESGDILIKEARLQPIRSGDLIAVLTTGAYNYSMASNYNRLPRPAVVAASGGTAKIVVRRESYADLVSNDVFGALTALALAAGSPQWEKED